MTALDRTIDALADPTRRRVIELLRMRPRRAGELAKSLRTTSPAMSRHLRMLRRSGLVEEQHDDDENGDARVRVYRLRTQPFSALRQWAQAVEQLNAFKEIADAHAK